MTYTVSGGALINSTQSNPNPLGSLQRFPSPLAGFQEPLRGRRTGKEVRGRKGKARDGGKKEGKGGREWREGREKGGKGRVY